MGIYDYLDNRKYEKDISKAEEIFLQQKSAIQGLKGTTGLKEIKAYWERQKEINENMFDQTGEKVYFKLYQQCKQFLNFIENLSS